MEHTETAERFNLEHDQTSIEAIISQTTENKQEIAKRTYEKVDPKIPLTDRELDFLSILIEKGISVEKAVFQAGYRQCSMNQRYNIGRKIIKKYESTGPGGRILFRDVGFGELTVSRRVRS